MLHELSYPEGKEMCLPQEASLEFFFICTHERHFPRYLNTLSRESEVEKRFTLRLMSGARIRFFGVRFASPGPRFPLKCRTRISNVSGCQYLWSLKSWCRF